jgi:hypothetical protein
MPPSQSFSKGSGQAKNLLTNTFKRLRMILLT